MIKNKIELIKRWWYNKISDNEFKLEVQDISNKNDVIKYIIKNVKNFIAKKDYEMIEEFIIFIYDLELFDEKLSEILCELSKENWHYSHEDIVFLFELIASPKTIDCIYELALKHEYEGYDGSLSIARKCTYALGKINTPKSEEKLKKIANNSNEPKELRDYVKEQLKINTFTNKDV